jgi:hypothetical protein
MKDYTENVKESIGRLETSWNHKNGYLWVSAFTDSCDYIDIFGHYHKDWSRASNQHLHERVWATAYAKSHMSLKFLSLDFPSEKICVVVLACHLEYEVNGLLKNNETVITCILEHIGVEWLIRNFQNTAFRPY